MTAQDHGPTAIDFPHRDVCECKDLCRSFLRPRNQSRLKLMRLAHADYDGRIDEFAKLLDLTPLSERRPLEPAFG